MKDISQTDPEENLYIYNSAWTKELESLEHWNYYWHQQKIMQNLVLYRGEDFLEIGVGSGFSANYCRSKGAKVTTLDIDQEKKPDIVANAVYYDFKQKYDYLMAYEVLEHIPYNEFEIIVKKFRTFIKKYVFISLPRNERPIFSLNLKLPKIKPVGLEWKILNRKITTAAHHWELDYNGFSIKRVEQLFKESGLTIVEKLEYKSLRFYALSID